MQWNSSLCHRLDNSLFYNVVNSWVLTEGDGLNFFFTSLFPTSFHFLTMLSSVESETLRQKAIVDSFLNVPIEQQLNDEHRAS